MLLDPTGRPVPTSDNPPHLWLVAPSGMLCVLCLRFWQEPGMQPYEPCWTAADYAKQAIKMAEQASGLTVESFYVQHMFPQQPPG